MHIITTPYLCTVLFSLQTCPIIDGKLKLREKDLPKAPGRVGRGATLGPDRPAAHGALVHVLIHHPSALYEAGAIMTLQSSAHGVVVIVADIKTAGLI